MTHRATTIRLDQAFLRIGPSSEGGPGSQGSALATGVEQAESLREAPPRESGALFRPALEVEQFAPSGVVKHFLSGRVSELASCLSLLRQLIPERPRIVGFAAGESRQGCTTVVLITAYELARAGERVLAIDCAPDHGLAGALGVDIDQGWGEAVIARTPLREVTIRSIQDGFDLLPSRRSSNLTSHHFPALRLPPEYERTYDWILIDFGTFFTAPPTQIEPHLGRPDKSLRDISSRPPHPIAGCDNFIAVQRSDSPVSVIPELRKRGHLLGVIETFVPPHAGENRVELDREAA